MAKRRSNKKAKLPKKQKSDMSGTSGSSVSLMSHGRGRSYRWRYLQLIKDGLVWLTGKRTRGVRISESAIEASNRQRKRRRAVSPMRVASLRFKAIRGAFQEDKKSKTKKSAKLKRGGGDKRMTSNAHSRRSTKTAGLKRGRKKKTKVAGLKKNRKGAGLRKKRKGAGLKRKMTDAGLKRKPTKDGAQRGRVSTGRPRGRPKKLQSTDPYIFLGGGRQRIVTALDDGPTTSFSPGQSGASSSPKRAGTKRNVPGGEPRSSRIVLKNISKAGPTRNRSPLKNRSPNRVSSKSSLFD